MRLANLTRVGREALYIMYTFLMKERLMCFQGNFSRTSNEFKLKVIPSTSILLDLLPLILCIYACVLSIHLMNWALTLSWWMWSKNLFNTLARNRMAYNTQMYEKKSIIFCPYSFWTSQISVRIKRILRILRSYFTFMYCIIVNCW